LKGNLHDQFLEGWMGVIPSRLLGDRRARKRCCWFGTMPVGTLVGWYVTGPNSTTIRRSVRAACASWFVSCQPRVRGSIGLNRIGCMERRPLSSRHANSRLRSWRLASVTIMAVRCCLISQSRSFGFALAPRPSVCIISSMLEFESLYPFGNGA
jgi:hypothetical protein